MHRKKRKRIDRREYYLWMRRIFRILEKGEWEVRIVRLSSLRGSCLTGLMDPAARIIYIDACSDLIPTLIHECLHAYFVDSFKFVRKEEKLVRKLEFVLVCILTPGHIVRLRNRLLTERGILAPKFPLVNFDRD